MQDQPSLSKLQADIHTALKSWHSGNPDTGSLDYLQLFQQVKATSSQNTRQITNKILYEALDALAAEHQQQAILLRRRFLDGLTMHAVANQLNLGESTAYRKQQEALRQLALVVQAHERQARSDYQTGLEKRLKLPHDVPLFGVEGALTDLQTVLVSPEPRWLFAIEGLGGIGKTTLAASLLRRPELTSRFYDVVWISAKQREFLPGLGSVEKSFPALTAEALTDALLEQLDSSIPLAKSLPEKQFILTRRLKQNPYLIVIDNLETVADYQVLLPVLREWANPSRFLLTSRHSLRAHPDVYCRNLDELGWEDALPLIRHEASVRGLSILVDAAEADLQRIYQVVGGNPLALKLVVGQVSVLPLTRVLDQLKTARGKTIDEMYTFIYWQAWEMLDAVGQQVFLMMPLAQDGTLAQLMGLTKLDVDTLSEALLQLARLSLVQVGGNLEERRYSIHRLTETFLLKEAINWQSSSV